MITDNIRQSVERIETIYAEYQTQLSQLKAERAAIISDFIREMEQSKLEEVRKIIAQK
jgi:F0F1-type ATP synthase membrane subunit b/b'